MANAVHRCTVVQGASFRQLQAEPADLLQKMRCVERFATGKYDNELLIQEQERMSKFVLETERKQFVQERCPLGPLQRGAMYAGLEPVCSNAFVWLFGVSTDLIAAVKGTPKARASSSIGRQVVEDVTVKFEYQHTHNLQKGPCFNLSCFCRLPDDAKRKVLIFRTC